jgi:hypothetical protein
MEHIMQIQVRINEEGALRNQRYAFTDRFTLVSELLQNARRAGAMRIEIHYDATTQVLRVEDDGRGLDDFQKLLSFHESGWDAATSAEERPFVGFSKCLYAATRCIVASKHQRVDINTAAALAKASIEVEPITEAVAGTGSSCTALTCPTWAIASRACAWAFRWRCCSTASRSRGALPPRIWRRWPARWARSTSPVRGTASSATTPWSSCRASAS